ncbi:hypothetical protein GQ600_10301 [Phytophthora cactorum]|nr:hypothetical protein GQ600_10301 [Phytophthora cactorum]
MIRGIRAAQSNGNESAECLTDAIEAFKFSNPLGTDTGDCNRQKHGRAEFVGVIFPCQSDSLLLPS